MKLMILFGPLFVAAAPADPLTAAIGFMQSAQQGVQAAPKACGDALRTQVKAARMQLELSKEAKDLASAESTLGGLKELSQEAKQVCPPSVASDIDRAIAALNGQPMDPDDDDDLKAEAPKDASGFPAGSGPQSPTQVPDTRTPGPNGSTKPFISPAPMPSSADIDQQVADAAKILARGFMPLGSTLHGFGKRTDWVQNLEAGKCYAFVGVGAASTKRIALYLWDPQGKRRSDRRAREPLAVVYHCPFVGGSYHIQAKVKRPDGGYAVGVFTR